MAKNFDTLDVSNEIKNEDKILVGLTSGEDEVLNVSTLSRKIYKPRLNSTVKNGLLIPMYIYPADAATNVDFQGLVDLKRKYRDVPMISIVNPASGPGAFVDGNYAMVINHMNTVGIETIGYVSTDYTNRAINLVKNDIDQWINLYPNIKGIFFDEQSDGTADLVAEQAYYKELAEYVYLKDLEITVSNPGVNVDNSWYDLFDIIVEWENSILPILAQMKGDWPYGKQVVKRSIMIHSYPTLDFSVIDEQKGYYGWVYYTDDELPNPWDSVPAYLEDVIKNAGSINGNAATATNATNATTHINDTTPHSATSDATADRLMLRDANGRAKVAAPSATGDIARLDTVDKVKRLERTLRYARYSRDDKSQFIRTWVNSTNGVTSATWNSVCWSPELGKFVAVSSGANTMSSSDGVNWANSTNGVTSATWHSVCWSPELGKFVAIATGSTNTMSSSDGVNWVNSTEGVTSANWRSVCWSPELGKFVAVASNSTNTMSSSDGVNWVNSTAGVTSADWFSVCWSPELGKFVAVSTGSTNTMSSSDGVNWVNSTEGVTDASWYSVCWSPELGKFVAIANGVDTMSSSDGVIWVNSTAGVTSATWTSVCWSPELGKFVAVSFNSANTMSSSDGVNWVNSTAGVTSAGWIPVCWSPELGKFVAIANGSTNTMSTKGEKEIMG